MLLGIGVPGCAHAGFTCALVQLCGANHEDPPNAGANQGVNAWNCAGLVG